MTDSWLNQNAVLARLVIEAAPIGIFSYDCEGRITLTNRAQLRINHIPDDVSVDSFIGMSILEQNPVIVANNLLEPLRQVLNGQPFEVEREAFRTRSNHIISVKVQGVPLYDDMGHVAGGLVMIEDITARVRGQHELRQSEARYHQLVTTLPDLILRMNRQGRFIDYEATGEEWFVPPHQFLHRTVNEVLDPHYARQTMSAIECALKNNTTQVLEYFFERNNERFFYEARLVPDKADEVLVVIRNVTEQKIAEQELIESEKRFRSLAEALPDMMFHLDHEGAYLDFSIPRNAGFFLPAREDIIGKKIMDVIPAQAASTALPRFYEALRTGQVTVVEYSILEGHGKRYYECRFSPTANQEVIAVVRDITERRKRERLLKTIAEVNNYLLSARIADAATLEYVFGLLGDDLNANSVLLVQTGPSESPKEALLSLQGRWNDRPVNSFGPDSDQWRERAWPASILPWADRLAEGTVVRAALTLSAEDTLAVWTGLDALSVLIVPVSVGGTWWGMLLFADQRVGRVWTQDDESALTTMAAGIGGFLERNRVESHLRHEREMADILREVGTAISSTLDLSEISERLLHRIRRIVDFDAASIALLEQGRARTIAHHGFERFSMDSNTIANTVLHIQDMPLLQQIMTTGEPRILRDVTAMGPDQISGFGLHGLQALIGVPIVARGNSVIGVFWLTSARSGLYDNVDELLPSILTIAQQAAFAFENARLYNELQHSIEELQLLQEAGQAVLSDLELNEMLFRLADKMAEITHVTGVIVCRYAAETRMGIVEASIEQPHKTSLTAEFSPRTIIDVSSPLAQAALQKDGGRVFYEGELPEVFPNTPTLNHAQSVVIIPLRVTDRIRGFVLLCTAQQAPAFRESQISLCEALADQVAIMLEQARLFKDIHALERIKTRMINMASHDLRGPLTRISNALMMLSGEHASLSTEQQQSVEIACHAVTDLEEMIRKLLSLKRIEEQHRKAEPVDWPEVIRSAIASQQADIVARQQMLNVVVAPDLPMTFGDPVQLVHALANLIQNAIKFTPPNGEITLCGYIKDYGGKPCVAIEVHDTGRGIPAELQEELFTPFYRAQYEDSPDIPGTGLGLWIVKSTIEDHNGSVYFDSIPQQGSMFGFWVPAD